MYELTTTDDERAAATGAAQQFMDYTAALIAEKRARPDALLVSELARVDEEGTRLTDPEIISTVIVLLNAGHEATVNTLGNGMRALLLHPQEWDRLVSREVPAAVAVEELIRWDGPLQLFERWVLDDGVAIADQPVAKGHEVAMLFGSADRDPRRFDDPDRFDVGRGDAAHIGFGGGIHFCVGAPLARLELAVSLATLVRRCPTVQMVEPPTYHPTFVIRGLRALQLVEP
jgi:cytochrome P450